MLPSAVYLRQLHLFSSFESVHPQSGTETNVSRLLNCGISLTRSPRFFPGEVLFLLMDVPQMIFFSPVPPPAAVAVVASSTCVAAFLLQFHFFKF